MILSSQSPTCFQTTAGFFNRPLRMAASLQAVVQNPLGLPPRPGRTTSIILSIVHHAARYPSSFCPDARQNKGSRAPYPVLSEKLHFYHFDFFPVLTWHCSDCLRTASSSLEIKQPRTVIQCQGKLISQTLGTEDLPIELKYSRACFAGPWYRTFPKASNVRLSNSLNME